MSKITEKIKMKKSSNHFGIKIGVKNNKTFGSNSDLSDQLMN